VRVRSVCRAVCGWQGLTAHVDLPPPPPVCCPRCPRGPRCGRRLRFGRQARPTRPRGTCAVPSHPTDARLFAWLWRLGAVGPVCRAWPRQGVQGLWGPRRWRESSPAPDARSPSPFPWTPAGVAAVGRRQRGLLRGGVRHLQAARGTTYVGLHRIHCGGRCSVSRTQRSVPLSAPNPR
jgi:hypothetical protein